MKKLTAQTAVMVVLLLVVTAVGVAQERTEETVTTTDSTGKTVTTQVIRISKSEDITERNSMLILNPLKFFFFYNLSYFRKISNSVTVGGGFQTPTLEGISGIGFNAEARFHPSGKGMRGFYVAPNIAYNYLSGEDSDESVSALSLGGLVGWQWFPGDDFAIGLGIGLDYYIVAPSTQDTNDPFDNYTGTAPALRFDIGYAW